MSHNVHDRRHTTHQWGGTGIVSLGQMADISAGAGSDKAKLGRWTWARCRGANGTHLRVISIYCPCSTTANKKLAGSVHSQHKRHLQDQNDDREPRHAFFQDLAQELDEWTLLGDHIIICGDVNESVFHSSITDFLEPFNLRNLIFTTHNPSNAPRTYYRTTSGRIIDGMWGSPSIQVAQCGYSDPSASPGGHSMLWADITLSSAIGHTPETPETPTIKRLRLDNSKIVRRYLTEYSSLVKKNHLLHWQTRLNESITQVNLSLLNKQNLRTV